MNIPTEIQVSITNATAKALATTGPAGVNVVPVSVVEVSNTDIVLFDFFMNKTIQNVVAEPTASLSCWNGLTGVQIKCDVVRVTDGERLAAAQEAMAVQFPERTLRGLLVLTPTAYYDSSADSKTAGKPIFDTTD